MKKVNIIDKIIKEEIDGVFKQYFVKEDDLLRGITFEELITAIESNEKEYTEETIKKVFEEMVRTNLIDAKATLRSNMRSIMKELKKTKLKEINLTEKTDDELEQAIKDNVISAANKDYEKWSGRQFKGTWKMSGGNKFIRIVRDEPGGTSAWGFVALEDGEFKGLPHKRGDVFKAASWQSPARTARGNAFEPKDWKWTGPDYLR